MRAKILILVIFIIRKSYKNILIYGISNKTFIVAKPLLIAFKKVGGLIKIYDGIKDLNYLLLKDLMQFFMRLIIL